MPGRAERAPRGPMQMEYDGVRRDGTRIPLFFLVSTLIALGAAGTAYAHQPHMVTDTGVTRVEKPEVSKAFYAELHGKPAVYEIASPDSFDLYVNILVSDEVSIPTDLSVNVTSGPDTIVLLDGRAYKWTEFYEPHGGDSYLMGPEERLRVGPGTYAATVSRPGNEGRYVLAVGEREEFPPSEIIRVIGLMPRLKRDFFHKAPIRALFDPLGSLFRRAD